MTIYSGTGDKQTDGYTYVNMQRNKDGPVEGFPKAQEDRPVQMAPVAAQLQDGHVPLLHVGVCLCLIILQVKGSNWRRNAHAHTHTDEFGLRVEVLSTRYMFLQLPTEPKHQNIYFLCQWMHSIWFCHHSNGAVTLQRTHESAGFICTEHYGLQFAALTNRILCWVLMILLAEWRHAFWIVLLFHQVPKLHKKATYMYFNRSLNATHTERLISRTRITPSVNKTLVVHSVVLSKKNGQTIFVAKLACGDEKG